VVQFHSHFCVDFLLARRAVQSTLSAEEEARKVAEMVRRADAARAHRLKQAVTTTANRANQVRKGVTVARVVKGIGTSLLTGFAEVVSPILYGELVTWWVASLWERPYTPEEIEAINRAIQ